MGAIRNIPSHRLTLLFGLILVLASGSALADDASRAALGPIEAPGRRSVEITHETGAVDATLPLTRAATRQRIETMSPTEWLATPTETWSSADPEPTVATNR